MAKKIANISNSLVSHLLRIFFPAREIREKRVGKVIGKYHGIIVKYLISEGYSIVRILRE